jgi:hypothetical protein
MLESVPLDGYLKDGITKNNIVAFKGGLWSAGAELSLQIVTPLKEFPDR